MNAEYFKGNVYAIDSTLTYLQEVQKSIDSSRNLVRDIMAQHRINIAGINDYPTLMAEAHTSLMLQIAPLLITIDTLACNYSPLIEMLSPFITELKNNLEKCNEQGIL